MRNILYILLFFSLILSSVCRNSFAQTPELNKEKNPTKRIEILKGLIKQHRNDNYELTLKYFNLLLKELKSNKDLSELAYQYGKVGILHENNSKYETALVYFDSSLNLSLKLKDTARIGQAYNLIGNIYEKEGKNEKALDYYYNSLRMHESIKNDNGIANTANNIGLLLATQKEFDEALKYMLMAYEGHKRIRDSVGMGNGLNNIGMLKVNQKKLVDGEKYLKQALQVWTDIGDEMGQAMTLNNLGMLYLDENDQYNALKYFQLSNNICEKLQNEYGIMMNIKNIGILLYKQRKYKESIEALKKSVEVCRNLGVLIELKFSYEYLSLAYEKNKQFENALQSFKLYNQYSDSVEGENTYQKIAEIENKYGSEKKQKAIELLKKHQQLKDTELEKHRTIRNSALILLFIIILFSAFIYNRFMVSKKQNKIIEEQKKLVEKQKADVDHANEELKQINEEIAAHRDEIENQKQLVEEKQKEVISSITYAKRLQRAILPSIEEVKSYLPESFIFYQPKDIVAGDFYWMHVIQFENERKFENLKIEHAANNFQIGTSSSAAADQILIAAADCTGHGVPGAMVSVVCSNALNRAVKEFGLTDPGKILDKVTELVIETFEKSGEEIKDGMDISLLSIKKKDENINVKWAGANNPLWIIKKELNELTEVKADKQPIGKNDNHKPFTTHIFNLSKGDSVYLLTDGYADQFGGAKGKKLKQKQFKEILLATSNESIATQKEILYQKFNKWKGNLEQVDDVCVIGIRV